MFIKFPNDLWCDIKNISTISIDPDMKDKDKYNIHISFKYIPGNTLVNLVPEEYDLARKEVEEILIKIREED